MSKYEVGQILYLTNEKSFKIIPVQVVEEVTRTTIEGVFKTYHVQFPDKNKTVADIADLKFKCFKTEKEVKDYLMTNTRSAIEKLLSAANELKTLCFSYQKDSNKHSDQAVLDIPVEEKNEDSMQQEIEDDIIKIDLGNGQVGKINTSNLKQIGS